MCFSFFKLLYFRLDLLKDTKVSLSANHLQKLRLSFQLTTPLGHTFKPHQVTALFYILTSLMLILFLTWFSKHLQVFLKLKHESNAEHLFVVPGSARQFKIVLVEYLPPPLPLEFALLVFCTIALYCLWQCGCLGRTLSQLIMSKGCPYQLTFSSWKIISYPM